MGTTLGALHHLQEIQLQITELQGGIDRKRRAVTRQQKVIEGIDAAIAGLEKILKQQQVESSSVELEIKSREAELAKLRNTLNQAKTNKEYSAVLTQLNTTKADNSKIEERGLVVLGQVDESRKKIDEHRRQREAETARLEDYKAAVIQAEAAAGERLARLRAEKEQAADNIPPQILGIFEKVAEKNEGQAMANVVRTHPKRTEYACEGCNMSLTLQQVHQVMSRDEIVMCNSCGRILYSDAASAKD